MTIRAAHILATCTVAADRVQADGASGRVEHALAAPFDIGSVPGLFSMPVKNVGRFPDNAKATCAACALLLRAAGIDRGPETTHDIAVLSAGFEPTAAMNAAFFRDYVEGGRSLGRGNLFIYTLPTSALAEASILLGLTGPSFYIEAGADPWLELVETGRCLVDSGRVPQAILLWWRDDHLRAALVAPETMHSPSA